MTVHSHWEHICSRSSSDLTQKRFIKKLWCRVIGEVEHSNNNNYLSNDLIRQGSKLRKFGAHTLETRSKISVAKGEKVAASWKKFLLWSLIYKMSLSWFCDSYNLFISLTSFSMIENVHSCLCDLMGTISSTLRGN